MVISSTILGLTLKMFKVSRLKLTSDVTREVIFGLLGLHFIFTAKRVVEIVAELYPGRCPDCSKQQDGFMGKNMTILLSKRAISWVIDPLSRLNVIDAPTFGIRLLSVILVVKRVVRIVYA